jgi:hypothetical protein
VLFTDTNDYTSGTHLHRYCTGMHNIRLYLITDIYHDYMFQLVNGHFRVNFRHTNPSMLNITH